MKKLLTILFLIYAVAAFMTQIDDQLSEESTSLIDRLNSETTSESFLYLNGIFANETEDPTEVGRKLLEEYRKLHVDESYEVKRYPEYEKIPLPTGDEFCKAWESECMEYMFSSQFDIEKLLTENRLLITRSNKFIEFDEYKTLSKPTIYELLPPYQYIAVAERIKVLEAISVYRGGNTSKAIDSLSLQFSRLRRTMELQDNLIGKVLLLSKLSEIIDVLSVILTKENIAAKLVPSLSKSEKSFFMIASREFGISYYIYKNMDKHPEFFEIGGNFSGWITRMIFKPNMTINAVAPTYTNLEHLSVLSPSEFATRIETNTRNLPSTSKIRNYIGSVLIQLSSPQYAEFVARFQDFEAKLELFNQVHHFKLELDSMKNPYYGDEVPTEKDGKLCFAGPLEDERSLRCLRVKI